LSEPPWIIRADLADEHTKAAVDEAGQVGVVVVVDGVTARTLDTFFSAVSTTLNFPDYFGRNWEALKDCLTDLDWLPGDSYLLIFRNADQLFADELIERTTFLRIMNIIAEEWAVPVALGEWWDRPAIPFHVILDDGVSEWSNELLHDLGSLA
jgi:RNAse (barnase) inhibitor barstar